MVPSYESPGFLPITCARLAAFVAYCAPSRHGQRKKYLVAWHFSCTSIYISEYLSLILVHLLPYDVGTESHSLTTRIAKKKDVLDNVLAERVSEYLSIRASS